MTSNLQPKAPASAGVDPQCNFLTSASLRDGLGMDGAVGPWP